MYRVECAVFVRMLLLFYRPSPEKVSPLNLAAVCRKQGEIGRGIEWLGALAAAGRCLVDGIYTGTMSKAMVVRISLEEKGTVP